MMPPTPLIRSVAPISSGATLCTERSKNERRRRGGCGIGLGPIIVGAFFLRSSPRPAYARTASFGGFAVRRSAEREGGKRGPSTLQRLDARVRGHERSVGYGLTIK